MKVDENIDGVQIRTPFFLQKIGNFVDALGALLFPIRCQVCGRYMQKSAAFPLCGQCLRRVDLLTENICQKCGRVTYNDSHCDMCKDGKTPGQDFPIRAVARYSGAIRELIVNAKRPESNVPDLIGKALASIVYQHVKHEQKQAFIIPVPLHPNRLRYRGFNLPDRMAKRLAKDIGGRYKPEWLVREIDTEPQQGKNFTERLANVKGAFLLKQGIEKKLENRFVIVVDDVATTGATLAATAEPLILSGAKVLGVTLARA